MLVTFKQWLVRILSSPSPGQPSPDTRKEQARLVLGAVVVGVLVLVYKLKQFLGLGTTSDLYIATQLATSWLDGKFLHDNFYGNHLAIHTYLLGPLLAVLARPFGSAGLLMFLGLAAGGSVLALVRILRLFAVPGGVALGYALITILMPLSVHVLQDNLYGFHFELLEPVLALWLAYFLLRRHWRGSLLMAVTLIMVKEDAPLLVGVVAVMVLMEDFIRSCGRDAGGRWNLPAAVAVLLALLAVPVLLLVLKTQQVAGMPGNLARLNPVGSNGITSTMGLIVYFLGHIGTWLRSGTVAAWLAMALPATFGLIILRPHLLAIGVVTTLIAWLMQDALLWSPRLVQALVFYQIAGCLAFATAWQLWRDGRSQSGGGRLARGAMVVLVGLGIGLGLWKQLQLAPHAAEAYQMNPASATSPADRQKADRLFAQYRREGRRDEPVIAAPGLFRYAHDRNLLWVHVLKNRPRPEWILWDTEEAPLKALWVLLKTEVGLDLSDYELRGREGRFVLIKRRPAGSAAPPVLPGFEPVAFTGAGEGAVAMQVCFAPGRAGSYEPLLSLGPKGRGDVFFVHYLSEHQLALGMESMGAVVHASGPVEYVPGRAYELTLFSGSLLPPAGATLSADEETMRLYCQNLVSVRWDGREVLNALAPPHAVGVGEVFAGFNVADSGSAGPAFTGEISEMRRVGHPRPDGNELGRPDYGAVRLTVQMPVVAAGVPEPLLVAGVAGQATLGYVRILPGGKAKLGAEIWGLGAFESGVVVAPVDGVAEVVFCFPALYPPVGDPRWGEVPRAQQEFRRARLTILFNGRVVLDRETKAADAPSSVLAFGKNPVGGSWVTRAFSGRLLQGRRLPLSAP